MDAGTSNLALIVKIRGRRARVAVLRDGQIVSHSAVSMGRSSTAEVLTEQVLDPLRSVFEVTPVELVGTLLDSDLRLISDLALPDGIEGALERATGFSVVRETR